MRSKDESYRILGEALEIVVLGRGAVEAIFELDDRRLAAEHGAGDRAAALPFPVAGFLGGLRSA